MNLLVEAGNDLCGWVEEGKGVQLPHVELLSTLEEVQLVDDGVLGRLIDLLLVQEESNIASALAGLREGCVGTALGRIHRSGSRPLRS